MCTGFAYAKSRNELGIFGAVGHRCFQCEIRIFQKFGVTGVLTLFREGTNLYAQREYCCSPLLCADLRKQQRQKKKQSERDRAAIDVWGTVSTTTSSNSSTSKFPLEGRAETTGNAIVPPLRSRSGPHYQGVGGRRRGRGHGDEEEAAGKKKQARTQHVYSRIEEEYERARK